MTIMVNNRTFILMLGVVAAALLTCDYSLPYRPGQFVPPTLSVPIASRDMVRDFLKKTDYRFKFAFTRKSDQSIYIVDFSGSPSPRVYRFVSNGQPDSPLFSPDGQWITWFVRLSATTQKVYVRSISDGSAAVEIAAQGTDPHFWEDSLKNLFVVYSDKYQVSLNELPAIQGYATYRQKVDPATGQKSGSREVLAEKPFNGGLSEDGRYLCTGYSDGALYDLVERRLHRINYDAASGGMQICNPSIAPDSAHRDWMLFLPFAGTQKLDFSEVEAVLGMIRMHEYLFVVDKENKVRWQRTYPAGYHQWQDPEWTNDFNYIVALAKVTANESDTRHDCFLIRQSDHAVLRLTTDEFRLDDSATPAFWIGRED